MYPEYMKEAYWSIRRPYDILQVKLVLVVVVVVVVVVVAALCFKQLSIVCLMLYYITVQPEACSTWRESC